MLKNGQLLPKPLHHQGGTSALRVPQVKQLEPSKSADTGLDPIAEARKLAIARLAEVLFDLSEEAGTSSIASKRGMQAIVRDTGQLNIKQSERSKIMQHIGQAIDAQTKERNDLAAEELENGKARNIQQMVCTTFWHPDGTPMSAQQFMELLFGKLPEFFKDEDELRRIWSDPRTRRRLLDRLAEAGFRHEQLAEMQKIIDAEKSDLFDVLAFVAYALPPKTREERAALAKVPIHANFDARQQAFLDFVLGHTSAMAWRNSTRKSWLRCLP